MDKLTVFAGLKAQAVWSTYVYNTGSQVSLTFIVPLTC